MISRDAARPLRRIEGPAEDRDSHDQRLQQQCAQNPADHRNAGVPLAAGGEELLVQFTWLPKHQKQRRHQKLQSANHAHGPPIGAHARGLAVVPET